MRAKRVAIVALKIKGKKRPFFADLRLKEYRSVDNPHDIIDETSVSLPMEDLIEQQPWKQSR